MWEFNNLIFHQYLIITDLNSTFLYFTILRSTSNLFSFKTSNSNLFSFKTFGTFLNSQQSLNECLKNYSRHTSTSHTHSYYTNLIWNIVKTIFSSNLILRLSIRKSVGHRISSFIDFLNIMIWNLCFCISQFWEPLQTYF